MASPFNSNRFSSAMDHLSDDEEQLLEKWRKELENDHYLCPIGQTIMKDPVMLVESGITYDRDSITTWLMRSKTCPITKKPSSGQMVPNFGMKNIIGDAKKTFIANVEGLVSRMIGEKRGLSDCLEALDECMELIDKKEERSVWERLALLTYKIMLLKKVELEEKPRKDWCDWFYRDIKKTIGLVDNNTEIDQSIVESCYNIIEEVSKFDTTKDGVYQRMKSSIEKQVHNIEEQKCQSKLFKIQKQKELEQRHRHARQEEERVAMQQQVVHQEEESTDWLTIGTVAGVIGAGALLFMGIATAIKGNRDEKR